MNPTKNRGLTQVLRKYNVDLFILTSIHFCGLTVKLCSLTIKFVVLILYYKLQLVLDVHKIL